MKKVKGYTINGRDCYIKEKSIERVPEAYFAPRSNRYTSKVNINNKWMTLYTKKDKKYRDWEKWKKSLKR